VEAPPTDDGCAISLTHPCDKDNKKWQKAPGYVWNSLPT